MALELQGAFGVEGSNRAMEEAQRKKRKTGEPEMPSCLLLIASSFMLVGPALADSQNWLVGSWRVVSATQTENG
jgi:hypothetical protein